jgi:hypothetical protein
MHDPLSEEVELGTPIHRTLDHFEAIHLALDLAL